MYSSDSGASRYSSGGGIGGLTLAAVLGRFAQDIHVDIYESDPEFNEIGAGISVWRRTWRIMEIVGLDKALLELAINPPSDIKSMSLMKSKKYYTEISPRSCFYIQEK